MEQPSLGGPVEHQSHDRFADLGSPRPSASPAAPLHAERGPRLSEEGRRHYRLYLNPPDHAAIFCVDEKLSKPWTVWILFCPSPGRAEADCFGYYRHGTLSLYAALDTQSGEILGKTLNAIPAPSSSTFLLT